MGIVYANPVKVALRMEDDHEALGVVFKAKCGFFRELGHTYAGYEGEVCWSAFLWAEKELSRWRVCTLRADEKVATF